MVVTNPGDDPFGLDEAYAVETVEDNRRLYARWADSYDDTFLTTHGYVYHESVVSVLERRLSACAHDFPVLDVGCGTGVVGIELRRRGYEPVDGIDLSPEMLGVAAAKTTPSGFSVYRHLHAVDLTEPIDLPLHNAIGLVSAGTFTHGHVGPEPIARLVDLLCAGGHAAIGVNRDVFSSGGFDDMVRSLEAADRITDVELVDVPVYDPDRYTAEDGDPNTVSRVILFSIPSS